MKNKCKIYWLLKIITNLIFIFSLAIPFLFIEKSNNNIDVDKSLSKEKQEEMRAIWVSYMDLNMNGTDYSENAFKEKFDKVVEDSKNLKINTLIVQVRPFSDSLYKSKIFPWSHIVSLNQGKDPGYDPLKYMIDCAHKNNLKIHAWVNPLRIQKNNQPKNFSENNPFLKFHNNMVVDYTSEKYYNPGYKEIRELIINGIKEIILNYDVDGIQLDDYFYPKEKNDFDTICYNEYSKTVNITSTLPINEWRISNINSLIAGIYSAIKSNKPEVLFGISPEGNIQNDISIGANVYDWCKFSGYIDYICPQLYFNFENPVLPFKSAVAEWKKVVQNKNIKLYYGLGVYKAGSEVDKGTWKKSNKILMEQINYARETGCDGFMLFSYEYINKPQTENEIKNVMKVFN